MSHDRAPPRVQYACARETPVRSDSHGALVISDLPAEIWAHLVDDFLPLAQFVNNEGFFISGKRRVLSEIFNCQQSTVIFPFAVPIYDA